MTEALLIHNVNFNDLKSIIETSINEALTCKIEKKAYSKKEFAQAIGKSQSFVDEQRRQGKLEWKLNGGTVSIPAQELNKYI